MDKGNIFKGVYSQVTGEKFDKSDKKKCQMLQNIIFLLGERGKFIDDYKFVPDESGVFSQRLENDIDAMGETEEAVDFDKDTVEKILLLRDVYLEAIDKYSKDEWMASIAAAVYMKKYMYPSYSWLKLEDYIYAFANNVVREDFAGLICQSRRFI